MVGMDPLRCPVPGLPRFETSHLERSTAVPGSHLVTGPQERNRTVSGWTLFLAGCHSDAMAAWDSEVAGPRSAAAYGRRGSAQLLLGQPELALEDFRAERRLAQHRHADPWIGIAFWQMGRNETACEDWSGVIDALHRREVELVDVAGGVELPAILWSASAYPELREWRSPAARELRRRWRTQRCQRSRWPGTIAGFLLGERSAEDLLSASASPAEMLQHRQRAEAHFYLGAAALDSGDSAEYHRRLELAVAENPIPIDAAYYLARAELARLTGQRLPVPIGDWSTHDRPQRS